MHLQPAILGLSHGYNIQELDLMLGIQLRWSQLRKRHSTCAYMHESGKSYRNSLTANVPSDHILYTVAECLDLTASRITLGLFKCSPVEASHITTQVDRNPGTVSVSTYSQCLFKCLFMYSRRYCSPTARIKLRYPYCQSSGYTRLQEPSSRPALAVNLTFTYRHVRIQLYSGDTVIFFIGRETRYR
ncbi:hypothetical protein SERLADRAFT_464859 [Serpula lacrymans var. lacrymans S7.9]|uniref:Uncharacterized protein n=1 Tax=Serpula lacrymans var. lacrymans (strain S7.9) TaxID=578457 RepID=F8NU74_SERL9|nr:uncharacterized protein SERLADRAFT_464859 [Serpula lacrymans var. lacrymans S7.9]EGO25148.1 hypothetical protein SERLADRAFT_464859 [Serpula lacrymans var. lacrymans S7.9]